MGPEICATLQAVSETKMNDKETTKSPARPSLSIDWELYGQYLEQSDLADSDKRELIETLWAIVVAFVDLGFGIHPLQNACGQDADWAVNLPFEIADMVESEDQANQLRSRKMDASLGSTPEGSRP